MAKILVIDDDESIRDVLTRILQDAGHEVITIDDGVHAKKAISGHKPDLIICDILMPQMDGQALIYHLKFVEKLKKAPIMILTSLGEEKRSLGKEVAADYYMAKPFDNEKLLSKVEELLKSGRVKVGGATSPQAPDHEIPERRKSLAYVIMTLSGAIIILAIYFLASSQNLEPQVIIPDDDPARSVNLISDKLFIFAVPVAAVIFVYQTYLLWKMSANKNKRINRDRR